MVLLQETKGFVYLEMSKEPAEAGREVVRMGMSRLVSRRQDILDEDGLRFLSDYLKVFLSGIHILDPLPVVGHHVGGQDDDSESACLVENLRPQSQLRLQSVWRT